MLANERPRRRQAGTSSVMPCCGSDLNFTTSCPGTTGIPPIFGATGPETLGPGRASVGFAGGAPAAPAAPLEAAGAGEPSSAEAWRLVSSVVAEEAQPPIAIVVANDKSSKERPLQPFDRIIICIPTGSRHASERARAT